MSRADNKILIEWPDSQRIMGHPDAELDNSDIYGGELCPAYWVSPEVWEQYKDTYYEEEEE